MGELTRLWKLPSEYDKILLPFEREFEKFLFENYQKNNNIRSLKFFYAIKPLIPRFLQIYLRRVRTKSIDNEFPHWPIESYLEDFKREILKNKYKDNKIPFIWFWPDKKNFAFVLTHDVETEQGLKNINKICEFEKKLGFRSAWFFVPEKYLVSETLIKELKEHCFEIGIHGLKHDGKLFCSKKIFDERMQKIEIYASRWGARGFRSPSLLRNFEWLKELPFEYDSSFPDTDPYGPQPGGCLSTFPFFIGKIVELPITLPQDHTLFEIRQDKDIKIWKQKIDWIEKMNGMALVIVHPDYINKKNLKRYEELLQYIKEKKECWFAKPIDISTWWKQRDESEIKFDSTNQPYIVGPAAKNGSTKYC